MADLKKYECEYYTCMAPCNHCLFCKHCTDVFFDYSNGPYLFICELGKNYGECVDFEEEVE